MNQSALDIRLFYQLIHLEPTALEVQREIIRYQQLDGDHLRRWQWTSRLRALLPSFSIGHDMSKSNNINIDRGSTSEPDQFIFGPEELDSGWDFDVDWDFSDLVWSTAQTSIDYRQRINIDYRNDILSDAMHIYFERRRTQIDILFSTAENDKEFLDKITRMEELTTLLDAFCGECFSRRLIQIYSDHPGLNRLWALKPSPGSVEAGRTLH